MFCGMSCGARRRWASGCSSGTERGTWKWSVGVSGLFSCWSVGRLCWFRLICGSVSSSSWVVSCVIIVRARIYWAFGCRTLSGGRSRFRLWCWLIVGSCGSSCGRKRWVWVRCRREWVAVGGVFCGR